MLSNLDALYVTPGPFSFFRREVFSKIGPYKEAHNTEDMEMAMRMQANGYKIKNCHTAFVYTIAPHKFSKLFTQRLRWTYGFLKNIIDYRDLFFNKQQGHLGFLVLPMMMISAFSTLLMALFFLINLTSKIQNWFLNWQAVNFNSYSLKNYLHFDFQWFYFKTDTVTVITVISFLVMIILILIGRKISEGKIRPKLDLLYFFIIYPIISPLWLAKSVYNVIISKKTAWR